MAHHLTLSTAGQHTRGRSEEVASERTSAGNREANMSVAGHSRRHLTLASKPVWRHRLILTGKLDDRSACELEEEIDCLCEEGVTFLTLDLRQLDAIDPIGAAVVAFWGAACIRRGNDFAVIPGSLVIQEALTEAGARDLLILRNEGIVRSSSEDFFSDRSTTMVKNL
jgi:hypothetical protein